MKVSLEEAKGLVEFRKLQAEKKMEEQERMEKMKKEAEEK